MRRGILATREELAALKDRINQAPFDAIHETLNRRCALILESAPVTEAQWRSLWHQGAWSSALSAARTTQGRILDLLVAHHIDDNAAYRDRAIEELKDLVSWTTWVDPCHAELPADLCTAEAAIAATVGLDWLWDDLTRADRLRIVKAIKEKAIAPYLQAVKEGSFWYTSCSNWNAVVNAGCGLAALALSDEDPSAAEALQLSRTGLESFFRALGREGGWDEGTGYWGLAMRSLLLFGEATSRLEDDQSILHKRGMDATGLFPIYFTPNGHPASFGDNPTVPLFGTLYLLIKHMGQNELTWWLDNYSFRRDVSTSGLSAAGLALLFRPADAECPDKPDLQPLKVFHEIGWAAMADQWPHPGMYVACKTGDLGASHSQHDMNSIQLQVDGEMLLVDLGQAPYSRRYFSEERGDFYQVQAQAHNTIIVAESDHRIDAQGCIIEAETGNNYRWVAMDSAGACGDDVHFVRHVVMVVNTASGLGETVFVLDELDSASPERVDLLWHTLAKTELDESGFGGVIRGRKAAVQFALASSMKSVVGVDSHKISHRRVDHVLRLTGGVIGRAYFASVFARRKTEGPLELIEDTEGVKVAFGETTLRFTPAARHLRLVSVESSAPH